MAQEGGGCAVKTINAKKLLMGALLALVVTATTGCVVAERPYSYRPSRRYKYVRPYNPYWYYWNRDYQRWQRDHDRWDRD